MRQVDALHYNFGRYQSAERFTSYYYQLRYLLECQPKSVLEIGIGDGLLGAMIEHYGIRSYGMDLDSNLNPSLCGSALSIPLLDASVDICAAFQVLEHLPFEHLYQAAQELARVCCRYTVISLPEHGNASFVINLPYLRMMRLVVPNILMMRPQHRFDGQHHWELNKQGFSRSRLTNIFREAGLVCVDTRLNPYNPYHRFFKFEKAYSPQPRGR
jgi:hypothetical protein